jgi:hypothetical protein
LPASCKSAKIHINKDKFLDFFGIQLLCEMCTKYGVVFVGIGVAPYHTVISVLDSQKDTRFGTYNIKMNFYTKNENSIWQRYLKWEDAPL